MDAMSNTLRRIILFVIAVLVLGVLAYNFKVGYEQRFDAYGDAREYIALGTTVAKTGSYGLLDISNGDLLEDFESNSVKQKEYSFDRYATWRPPVWPHIIAFVFLLTGYSLTALLIFKVTLLLLGAYLFYRTLLLLHFSKWIIILGSILYLIHPASQLYSRFFLSEPITLFFVTFFLFVAVRVIKSKSSFWLLGSLGGIVILCHPYFVFLPFAIYFFLLLYKKLSFKRVLFCGIITVAFVSLWVLRNTQVLDTNKPVITTSSGAVMAKGWNNEVVNNHTNTQGDLADEGLVLADFEYDKTLSRDEVAQSSLYTAAVVDFIKSNPDKVVPIISTKLRSAFNPFAETSKPGFLEAGRVVFHVLALIAMLYIIIFSKRGIGRPLAWALVVSTVCITIVTYSGFRFRMPQLVLELFLILAMLQETLGNRFKVARKNAL